MNVSSLEHLPRVLVQRQEEVNMDQSGAVVVAQLVEELPTVAYSHQQFSLRSFV